METRDADTLLQQAARVRMEIAELHGFHLGAASHAPGDEAEDHRNFSRALQEILQFVGAVEDVIRRVRT